MVFDSYTKFLSHCNVSPFIDEIGNAITNTGVTLDTIDKVFGAGSGVWDGADDWSIDDSEDWDFGTDDYTIDFRIKTSQTGSGVSAIIVRNDDEYGIFLTLSTGKITVFHAPSTVFSSTSTVNDGNWHHIAVVRYSGTVTIYIDGNSSGSLAMGEDLTTNSALRIGYDTMGNGRFVGKLDEIRISKGIARWTTDFTPPTSEYTAPNQQTITSDAYFYATQQTILSDAYFVAEELYDVNNKASFIKQVLSDINNKVGFVKQVLSDIYNKASFLKRIVYDINNDVRMKKRELYDIKNDVRFIKSWQRAGDFGFQSLGKEYIKVYINEIEQTDADIESLRIYKAKNQPHTATFDLGRAYDSSKPDTESQVIIKYHHDLNGIPDPNNFWVLYKGYISSITPGDDLESMTINCQNIYWLQNREKKYFKVGHKPEDDEELYHETINSALNNEFSLSWDIGNFVPEVIDCFGLGESDILSDLIENCGNYGWFYDIDENKKLCIDGAGDIINISRQNFGINIGLYQILSHNFTDDVSGVINKYKVQMGNKVTRFFNTSGGKKEYSGYMQGYWEEFLIPSWNSKYAKLAKNSINGYGWDYHPSWDEDNYRDTFKKYRIPYLESNLSLGDNFAPYIEVYQPGWFFGFSSYKITEGFSIDFENKTVTFNEPQYFYRTNFQGEMVSIRAANLKLVMSVKKYYSFTLGEDSDPETEIASPLMFFTEKMGEYPITIMEILSLPQFSIQEGGNNPETEEITPSWDDTEFAKDYANWRLSKTCDKKIRGNIELTMDAICFYNIDLTKRIYIEGITEVPMNIVSMTYEIGENDFSVNLELENNRFYKRTISLPSRGE